MPDELRAELRRSFRCGCGGEGWDRKPYRVTLAVLDTDPGEQILAGCERATGVRPDSCPWASLSDPFVREVMRAHRWDATGQLDARYGGHCPERIWWGVGVYAAALNAVQVHDMREDRKAREAEARERANAAK